MDWNEPQRERVVTGSAPKASTAFCCGLPGHRAMSTESQVDVKSASALSSTIESCDRTRALLAICQRLAPAPGWVSVGMQLWTTARCALSFLAATGNTGPNTYFQCRQSRQASHPARSPCRQCMSLPATLRQKLPCWAAQMSLQF